MPESSTDTVLHKPRKPRYRKLEVEIKRPSKTLALISWIMGVGLAVLFLLFMVIAYLRQGGK